MELVQLVAMVEMERLQHFPVAASPIAVAAVAVLLAVERLELVVLVAVEMLALVVVEMVLLELLIPAVVAVLEVLHL
jgi:hypothetical protein